MNDPSEELVATLRKIIRAIDLHSKNLTKKHGLTGPQLLVIKEFHKNPEQSVSQVSHNISLSQATVTAILDRLEKLEFVRRERNSDDKRKVNIHLLPKAIKILKLNPSILQDEFISKFKALESWEQSQILSSIQRIAEMMDAQGINSPPVLVSGPLAATEIEVKEFLEDKEEHY